MANSIFLVFYQMKNISLPISFYFGFRKSSYKQVKIKIFIELTARIFALNIQRVQ